MTLSRLFAATAAVAVLGLAGSSAAAPAFKDHYAQNGPVKIHYVSAGSAQKPLVVLIHGFPDFWYTWRNMMDELDGDYRVVALDTRGYNLSDKPEGVEAYRTSELVKDVEAVIAAEGRKSAIVLGHDWGASIAWNVALTRPESVDRLIIFSVPHPTNMSLQLKNNPVQQENSAYARNFQQPGSESRLTAEGLAGWVTDERARPLYVEAFKRSSFAAMMNYYRANYPSATGEAVQVPNLPLIKAPILVVHGVKDTALNAAGHNDTFLRGEKDTTVLWLPNAGHWIEQDAGPLVNRTVHDWLNARPVKAADQMAAKR